MKCLQNSPKCSSNLRLWAVSKRSRALWVDFSLERAVSCEQEFKSLVSWSLSLSRTRCELWARGQEPCELISLSNALWAVSKSSRALWADLSLSLERVLSCEQEFKSLLSHLSLSHVSFELRDWLTRSLLGSHRRCSGAALSATLESANGKLFCKHSSVFSWRCSSGQLGSVNKNSQEKSNFEAEMKILRKNQTWKRKWKFYRKI